VLDVGLLDLLNLKWNFYHPNAKWRFVNQFKPSRMGVTLPDVDKEVRSNPLRFGLSTTAWLTTTACGLDLSLPQNLDLCKFYAILEINSQSCFGMFITVEITLDHCGMCFPCLIFQEVLKSFVEVGSSDAADGAIKYGGVRA